MFYDKHTHLEFCWVLNEYEYNRHYSTERGTTLWQIAKPTIKAKS